MANPRQMQEIKRLKSMADDLRAKHDALKKQENALNTTVASQRIQLEGQQVQLDTLHAQIETQRAQHAATLAEHINLQDKLLTYAESGDIERVKAVMTLGARTDCVNYKGFNALTLSIINGRDAVTEHLTSTGLRFEQNDSPNKCILALIAREGNHSWMERALKHYPKDDREARAFLAAYENAANDEIRHMIANSILFQAVKQGSRDLVKSALSSGANADEVVHNGMTARQLAAYFDRDDILPEAVKPPADEPVAPPAYSSSSQRSSSVAPVSLFNRRSPAAAQPESLVEQAQALLLQLTDEGNFMAVACLGGALAEQRMDTVEQLIERHRPKSEAEVEKACKY